MTARPLDLPLTGSVANSISASLSLHGGWRWIQSWVKSRSEVHQARLDTPIAGMVGVAGDGGGGGAGTKMSNGVRETGTVRLGSRSTRRHG